MEKELYLKFKGIKTCKESNKKVVMVYADSGEGGEFYLERDEIGLYFIGFHKYRLMKNKDTYEIYIEK